MVALLRGINVGGRAKLAMADLRAVVESCGHTAVSTYIQSGNIVFRSKIRDPQEVALELATDIAAATNLAPAVLVRTSEQWSALVAANPFVGRTENSHLHVVVLVEQPTSQFESIDRAAFLPEEFAIGERHVYLLLPGGIGRSKLATAVDRQTRSQGTVRNWRTVTKLSGLLNELA